MLGLLLIIALGVWVMYQPQTIKEAEADLPIKLSERLDQLWSIAHESLQSKKYLRAEKALLTILRVDEKNASAYNRLGILYAKQKSLKDAIECFEIAQSLEPSASSLHNVGLIYYETGEYEKAALAFEQALAIDNNLPARHIAYAKVQEKLGHEEKMISALEKALELNTNSQTLNLLADAYERTGRIELATNIREKAAKLIMAHSQPTPAHIRQPRRVDM
jgi:tetratricopeptide (TPR) repeat protein